MLAEQSTVDVVEQRLLAWAAWLTAGRCAAGFPTRNVLNLSWTPPSPGTVPAMRVVTVSDRRERDVHAAVGALSVKLRDALYVVYVKRMDAAAQVQALGCKAATVRARVIKAKRQLGVSLRVGFTS